MVGVITQNWESIIASRQRPCATICKIEDASKRNSAAATKKWRLKNMERYKAKKKEWEKAHPEKVKLYQQRNKKNIKRWAEEHPERIRELGRINDRKRAKSPKRIAWSKEYSQRPEVIERRRERDRARNKTPERRAWFRERDRKRREAKKMNAGKIHQINYTITLHDVGTITVHVITTRNIAA